MSTITELNRTGDFLLSEAPGTYSRENEILASGQSCIAGEVLGAATASGKYGALDPSLTTGVEEAAGILWATTDATDADVAIVVIKRNAEVKADALIWPDGITTEQKSTAIAQLAELGIVLR
ncbi:head decoration protein [Xanthomonas maliensis]|uniref:head decoration protein n=1 Tax=Xanthomonas maliensis TaxID=1321368 RepID=UPI0003AAD711|nr:head decoration protein [Xanthomonas maliensis]KAB7767618.1 head decoration protein [Xanthomonas maliensis]